MPRNREDYEDDDEPRPRRKRTVDDDEDERPSAKSRASDSKKVEVRSLSQSRPKAVKDEVDDRPSVSSRLSAMNDDDDRPKPSSRRAADEDDDDRPKPKAKRSSADDDEDDRPKAKSRRPSLDDDDDDDRPSRRARRDYDEDDDDPRPKKKKRPQKKQLNVVGLVALVIGIVALLLSLTPCVSWLYALFPGIVGVVAGLVGLFVSHKSEGRQGMGLPIAGASINVAAILIALGLMILTKKVGEGFEKEFKDEIAKAEAREKERKVELAKAAPEVKNAQPGSIIRVSAAQFYKAYEDDDNGDRIYKGKILEITGTVQFVDFDEDEDEYVVSLRAGGEEFETVQCIFIKDPAIRAQLRALAIGSQVTIRGKCLGGTSAIEACILVR